MRQYAWVLFLFPLLSVGAETIGPVPGPSYPAVEIPYKKETENSISMPGGALYMPRGIYTSLAGGQYHNLGEESLYQWQGELGYFYTPWLSSGAEFKLLAGQPSDALQTVKNRFFIFSRFQKSWSHFAAYAGGDIGLEDLNVSFSALNDSGNIRAPLQEINAGAGLEFGLGWKFSRYVGLTAGQHFEASFVGEDTTEGSLNFRTTAGLNLDLLAVAPPMQKKVKALYLFVESQFGQLVLENNSKKHDFAWITGITLAF